MKPALRPYFDHIVLIILALLCYALFFHALGGIGMIGPDEPRYAAVAREMLRSGDYVTPRLFGLPWFEKPPLMYWVAALGYKIFGVGETGARFPSALGATISVFMIYWCGRRFWDRAAGFLAALILASSIGFFAFARAASMDMPLTACLTAALAFFLVAMNDQTPRRRSYLYGFYAALGLGVLAKGPIAVLLPVLALLGFTLLRGNRQEWRNWYLRGFWVTAAIAVPWFALCTIINGRKFIDVFFINQNIERFISTIHGHDRPFYFYLPVLLLLTFPWTFILISALRRKFGKNEQMLALWAIVPFVFFSFSGSKLPGYILPVVPAFALLCCRELRQPESLSYKVAVFAEAGTIAFIGVAFGFYGNTLNVDPHVSGTLIVVVTSIMTACLLTIALWLKPVFLGVFNSAAIIALVITATTLVFPRFERTDTMRPWRTELAKITSDEQEVYLYKPARWMEYGLQFYRGNHVRSIFSPEELIQATAKVPRILCVAEDKVLLDLTKVNDVDVEVVDTIGGRTAFWAWQVN